MGKGQGSVQFFYTNNCFAWTWLYAGQYVMLKEEKAFTKPLPQN